MTHWLSIPDRSRVWKRLKDFKGAVLFHSGVSTLPIADPRFHAVPLAKLWDIRPQFAGPRKLAERVGFEPTVPCGTPDFESGTIDHSVTSPWPGAETAKTTGQMKAEKGRRCDRIAGPPPA